MVAAFLKKVFGSEEDTKPKIILGGDRLECLLGTSELNHQHLYEIVLYFLKKDFTFTPDIVAQGITSSMFLNGNCQSDFKERIAGENQQTAYWSCELHGKIDGAPVELELEFHLDDGVFGMSVPEDMIWNFSSDISDANYDRLATFVEHCKLASNTIAAQFGQMGTSFSDYEDVMLEKAEREQAVEVNEYFFSAERTKALFDWYVTEYAGKWS